MKYTIWLLSCLLASTSVAFGSDGRPRRAFPVIRAENTSTATSTKKSTSTSSKLTTSKSVVTSKTSSSSSPSPSPKATNPSIPINGDGGWKDAVTKAQAFLAVLTLDEKVNLTSGVGILGRCLGNTGTVPRLNFPGFCFEDSPNGVKDTDLISVFPSPQNVASTFDRGLMYARGVALGAEFRGKGVNVALATMMNMARSAAAGRNWEGAGADPYLQGVHATQNVQGIQSQGVIACAKHYAMNEQEHHRGNVNIASSSNVDDRTFHEIYEWPFAAAVRAGVGSVMCAFNRVNNTYACENRRLMNDILKGELDFQGFIVSDWTATRSTVPSANNGLDVNMPGFKKYGDTNPYNPATSTSSWFGKNLADSVRNGTVSSARLDDMVTRLLAAWYQAGQDSNYPAVNFAYTTNDDKINGQVVNEHVNVQADHYKLIREIGSASTVMLKNNNSALPLNFSTIKKLAIIGSDAGSADGGPNSCRDHGCDQGTLAIGWGSGTATFPYLVSPADAIGDYMNTIKSTANITTIYSDFAYTSIKTAAQAADTCLVFVNANSGEEYLTVEGNQGDRNNLTLWHGGDTLISTVASVCANTIVTVHSTGAVIMETWWAHPNVSAILWAGLPGQESGNSLLDILNGSVNPSARLPYTIAKKRSDYGADVEYYSWSSSATPQINYTDKLNLDYRHFNSNNIKPRFEFGYGLSYTSFAYFTLKITKLMDLTQPIAGPVAPGGLNGLWTNSLNVTFFVKNIGLVDGNEIAQLYLGFPPSAGEPPKVLRGFDRMFIQSQQFVPFVMILTAKDLSVWDTPSQSWMIPSGTFTVYIGSSSLNIRLQSTFVV